MAPKARKIFGRPFQTERVVAQGDPFYPTLFNIVVDKVVRAVLLEVCGSKEAHHRFVWAAV